MAEVLSHINVFPSPVMDITLQRFMLLSEERLFQDFCVPKNCSKDVFATLQASDAGFRNALNGVNLVFNIKCRFHMFETR